MVPMVDLQIWFILLTNVEFIKGKSSLSTFWTRETSMTEEFDRFEDRLFLRLKLINQASTNLPGVRTQLPRDSQTP